MLTAYPPQHIFVNGKKNLIQKHIYIFRKKTKNQTTKTRNQTTEITNQTIKTTDQTIHSLAKTPQ